MLEDVAGWQEYAKADDRDAGSVSALACFFWSGRCVSFFGSFECKRMWYGYRQIVLE